MNIIVILKMLSDQNRLRIVNLIKENPMCVTEIQAITGLQQSNTSRHLEKLKSNNIVKSYKDSNKVFYILNTDFLNDYTFLKKLIFQDIKKETIFLDDLEKLNKYKENGYSCEDLRHSDFDFDKLTKM